MDLTVSSGLFAFLVLFFLCLWGLKANSLPRWQSNLPFTIKRSPLLILSLSSGQQKLLEEQNKIKPYCALAELRAGRHRVYTPPYLLRGGLASVSTLYNNLESQMCTVWMTIFLSSLPNLSTKAATWFVKCSPSSICETTTHPIQSYPVLSTHPMSSSSLCPHLSRWHPETQLFK